MAGMFYSLKEASEKLGKTEDEVRDLVKSGRLREFRDGANLLFKINEINALLNDTSSLGMDKPQETPEEEQPKEALAEEQPMKSHYPTPTHRLSRMASRSSAKQIPIQHRL
jgi:hypothetical protein